MARCHPASLCVIAGSLIFGPIRVRDQTTPRVQEGSKA
jgi:hypothetical protein